MNKKVNWWWVIATHENGRMCREELNALGMREYADWHLAARVFASLDAAIMWIEEMKRLNFFKKEIELQILNDEAWEYALKMYHRGKEYGLSLLS